MKLSVTNLVNWIGACERRWLWEQSWFPRGAASPLWLGSGVHEALASYYTSGLDAARGSYASWVAQSAHTLEAKVSPAFWVDLSKAFWEQVELGTGMLENYFAWEPTHPLPGKVVEVEKFLSAKFSTGDELRGRLDLILEDGRDLVVVDHKTYSSLLAPELLEFDQQLTAYAWLARKVLGRTPEKLILNVLFRRAPRAPEVLKNGGLSRAKSQATTYELYLQELVARGLDPSSYRDYLETLQSEDGSQFFKRLETSRADDELNIFEARAESALRRVDEVLNGGIDEAIAMPSFSQCRFCPFKQPCLALDRRDDWQWLLESGFSTETLL